MRGYLIGIGLVLFAIHNPNQPLLNYVFLPWVGLMLVIGAIITVPVKKFKAAGLGSRWVWIPLVLVSFAITASGLHQYLRGEVTLARGIAPFVSCIVWFGVYLVSRIEGDRIGVPLAYAVIIEAVSVSVAAFVSGGNRGGGLVSPTNYDIATAFMVFGTFLSPRKWQWLVGSFAIVGLFFTGAEEGLVAMGATALVLMWNKDYSKKLIIPVSALILALLVATPAGITYNLYVGKQKTITSGNSILSTSNTSFNASTTEKIEYAQAALAQPAHFNRYMDIATGFRWSTHWRIHSIQPFGYGYNLTNFYHGIPHNIILIIIEQVGLIGLAGWLIATIYCFRSKRYYLWASVLALGMFDHYSWTQIAPWWWAMVGISEAHRQPDTNIFREVVNG